jgi:hypothetical protein
VSETNKNFKGLVQLTARVQITLTKSIARVNGSFVKYSTQREHFDLVLYFKHNISLCKDVLVSEPNKNLKGVVQPTSRVQKTLIKSIARVKRSFVKYYTQREHFDLVISFKHNISPCKNILCENPTKT